MKRANHFFVLGIVGLFVSLTISFIAKLAGLAYDVWIYLIPWLIFLIIGLNKKLHVKS